jgi:hypothetical protein
MLYHKGVVLMEDNVTNQVTLGAATASAIISAWLRT